MPHPDILLHRLNLTLHLLLRQPRISRPHTLPLHARAIPTHRLLHRPHPNVLLVHPFTVRAVCGTLSSEGLGELGCGADLGALVVEDEDGDDNEDAEETEEGGGPFKGVRPEVGVHYMCGDDVWRWDGDGERDVGGGDGVRMEKKTTKAVFSTFVRTKTRRQKYARGVAYIAEMPAMKSLANALPPVAEAE